MADDDDAFGGEVGRIGSERWRARFFRDMRLTIRDENDTVRTEVKEALVALEQRMTESHLRDADSFQIALRELERRIGESRMPDMVESLRVWSESKQEDMPELKAFIQHGLNARRARRERVREISSAARELLWDFAKHTATAALLAGATYMGWTWLK